MAVEVSLIPSTRIHLIWPKVVGYLQEAIDVAPGRWDTMDYFLMLSRGQRSLFIVVDTEEEDIISAFTCNIYDTAKSKICAVEYVGGSRLEEWLQEALNIIEKYARQFGCNKIEGHGRKGWEKYLTKYNWKFVAWTLEKDLENVEGRE